MGGGIIMTLDATWVAVPMRASPHTLDRHSPEPDSTQTTSERCSTMRTHREPGIRHGAHGRIRAYVRANGQLRFKRFRPAHPLDSVSRWRTDPTPSRQLATELANTATRDRDLEEQQAYVAAANDGDYVGVSELAGAAGGECHVIQVLGGVDGPDPRGRVLDLGEPSQPAPTVRWPADAPVIGEVKWAARGRSCEE